MFHTEQWCVSNHGWNNVCSWRRGVITDHNLLFPSMRKWPGSSRAPQCPKITRRTRHTWRKTTSPCTQTPTSGNHRTTTTPAPDSSPSEPDLTAGFELMVRYRKWHVTWELRPGQWSSQCGATGERDEQANFNSQEKRCYFINIWKKLHSSWKHLFRCMSFNNHILWGERDIQREKNKTLQATDFSLNLSTDIFT